jgi:hypothetical protein
VIGIFSLFLELVVADIPISTAEGMQVYPFVSYSGENYLVIWTDLKDGVCSISGQIVSPDGELLGDNFEILPDSIILGLNRPASSGQNYLYLWTYFDEEGNEPHSYGRFISLNGELGDTFSLTPNLSAFPAAEFDGENYLVVFAEAYDEDSAWISGQFVSPEGRLIGSRFKITPPRVEDWDWLPEVVWNQEDYLVIWQRGSYPPSLAGILVGKEGEMKSEEFEIDTKGEGERVEKRLVTNGSGFLVLWADMMRDGWGELYGQVITETGELSGDPFVIAQGYFDQELPGLAAAFDSRNYLVVWTDCRDYWEEGNICIYGVWLDIYGNRIGEPYPVSKTPGYDKYLPDICFGDNLYLLVWTHQPGEEAGPADIYGNFISPLGIAESEQGRVSNRPVSFIADRIPLKEDFLLVGCDGRVISETGGYGAEGLPPGIYFLIPSDGGRVVKWVKVR